MKDEIKEILKYFKRDDKNKFGFNQAKILDDEQAKQLLNYITNLQEENVVLKSQLLQDNKSYHDMQDRIKKAIEYIKENACYGIQEKCCLDDLNYNNCDELLEILQGKSDE